MFTIDALCDSRVMPVQYLRISLYLEYYSTVLYSTPTVLYCIDFTACIHCHVLFFSLNTYIGWIGILTDLKLRA